MNQSATHKPVEFASLMEGAGIQLSDCLLPLAEVYSTSSMHLSSVFAAFRENLLLTRGAIQVVAADYDDAMLHSLENRYLCHCNELQQRTIAAARKLLSNTNVPVVPVKRPVRLVGEKARQVAERLTQWYHEHNENPLPSKSEQEKLAAELGISLEQVRRWFWNQRSRQKQKKRPNDAMSELTPPSASSPVSPVEVGNMDKPFAHDGTIAAMSVALTGRIDDLLAQLDRAENVSEFQL